MKLLDKRHRHSKLRFSFFLFFSFIVTCLSLALAYLLAPKFGISPEVPIRQYDGILVLSFMGGFILCISIMYLMLVYFLDWIFKILKI